MKTSHRVIGILTVSAMLTIGGCTGFVAKPLPIIPGTDTSSVTLLVNKEDGSVLLTGQVRRKIDARNIEAFVRREYGYQNITNQITSD